METQEFKGIWIPKEICNLENLTWTEKIILSEILAFSKQNECYANNEHFSKLLKIRKDSVSRAICKLVKQEYLISEIKYKLDRKQVQQRILKLNKKFFCSKNIDVSLCSNADTPMYECQSTIGTEAFDLSAQTPNRKYNINNNKKINNTYAQSGVQTKNTIQDETIKERFERFYNAYPKKKSKGKALSWFKTHKPDSSLVDIMIESLEKQKLTIDFQKENGRYIPYPATWLNARGWENEISPGEIIDLSENSVSRLLAIELYEAIKNVQFTLTTDTEKLIKSWTIDIEKYLSIERTREREDRVFYAINAVKNSDKWRKIIVDARSLIKNLDFIT
ncbi:MAG: helix-turn-helix domain-containing protein [Acutalibacteraceae bacterium]